MEIVLLSTLFSKTFRERTKELFFGHKEHFEDVADEKADIAMKLMKALDKEIPPEDIPEAFEDAPKKSEPMSTTSKVLLIVFFVISAIVGIYSAYLSWQTNTVFEISPPMKALFAFFAFLGGITYLVLFYIFRWSDVMYVKQMKGMLTPLPIAEAEPVAEPVAEPA